MKKSWNKIHGLFRMFSLGFGAIIGVGWSVTLNNMMSMGGGPLPTSIGFITAGLLLIPVALCFAELTAAMPVAGGVTAYAYRAFGPMVSFAGGWFAAMAYLSLLPWEAIAINDVCAFIFPFLREGPVLYEVMGEGVYLRALLLGIALSAIIIVVNWRGIDFAAGFQSVMTVVLLVCAAICIVSCALSADMADLEPLYANVDGKAHSSFVTGVLALTAMAPFYFAGFDTIPQGAEDMGAAIEPKRIGKAIVLTVLSGAVFYFVIVFFAGASYPWQQFIGFERPALSNLLRALYDGAFGEILFWVSIIGTLAGLLTTWNSFYIAGARLLLGMGRAGLLPPAFAAEHPRYKTPMGGSLCCAAVMLIGPFLGAGVIDLLLLISSMAFVIGWLLTCMSAYRLRRTAPDMERPYRMLGGRWMALLGCAASSFMLCNCILPFMPGYMGIAGVYVLIAWIALGVALYWLSAKYRKAIPEEERLAAIFAKKK